VDARAFEIICLANSRKYLGRCVAGLRLDGGGWFRPVTSAEHGTLPVEQACCGGREVLPLDVIRMWAVEPRPEAYQPENWLLARNRWEHVRRAGPVDIGILYMYLERGPLLLGSRTDRVEVSALERRPLGVSVALVAPQFLRWVVTTSVRGVTQVRAKFELSRVPYNLVVTDPVWERHMQAFPPGEHWAEACAREPGRQTLLSISLGEPFTDGCCYKLVAGVIELAGCYATARTGAMLKPGAMPKPRESGARACSQQFAFDAV